MLNHLGRSVGCKGVIINNKNTPITGIWQCDEMPLQVLTLKRRIWDWNFSLPLFRSVAIHSPSLWCSPLQLYVNDATAWMGWSFIQSTPSLPHNCTIHRQLYGTAFTRGITALLIWLHALDLAFFLPGFFFWGGGAGRSNPWQLILQWKESQVLWVASKREYMLQELISNLWTPHQS